MKAKGQSYSEDLEQVVPGGDGNKDLPSSVLLEFIT